MAENTEILRQRLYKTEMYMGDFDPNKAGGYDVKNQVSLYGCVWESKIDDNVSAPATWDGGDTIIPNTQDWKQVSGDYQAWLLNKDRPAQSEEYPFNNMGYVVLQKNIRNTAGEGETPVYKNLLTQDAFYKDGPNNTRVPNTNTIFEVRYGFELAEDVTIPSGSELRFVGGKITGAHTLTGTNTFLSGNPLITATVAGTFDNNFLDVTWFGAVGDDDTDCSLVIRNIFNICIASKADMYIPEGVYAMKTYRWDFGTYSEDDSRDTNPANYLDCNNISVYGDNRYSSIIKSYVAGDILNIACAKNVHFSNIGITLSSTHATTPGVGINCISLVYVCNISFSNVFCSNAYTVIDANGQDGGFGFTIQTRIADNIKVDNLHVKDCLGGFDMSIANEALNRKETNIELRSCIAEKCEKGFWFRNDSTGLSAPFIVGGIGHVDGKAINCMHPIMMLGCGYDVNINVINTETVDNLIKDSNGNYWFPQEFWASRSFENLGVSILCMESAKNNNIKVDAFVKEINYGVGLNSSDNNNCAVTINQDASLIDIYTTPATSIKKSEFYAQNSDKNIVLLNCKESSEFISYLTLFTNYDLNNTLLLNGKVYGKDARFREIGFFANNSIMKSASILKVVNNYPMFSNEDSDTLIYKALQVGYQNIPYGGMTSFGDLLRSTIQAGADYSGVDPTEVAGGLFVDVRDVNSVSTLLGHIPVVKKNKGTTAERTGYTMTGITAGYCWFDTTLNKPVWWTGSGWVDATGATV